MEKDFRGTLSKMLRDSYLARNEPGMACARCGHMGRPMFFNLVMYSKSVYSSLGETIIDGSFPICTTCVRPCRKCHLGIDSENLDEFFLQKQKELGESVYIHAGAGICEHMHFSSLVHALIKRLLKRGRFAS